MRDISAVLRLPPSHFHSLTNGIVSSSETSDEDSFDSSNSSCDSGWGISKTWGYYVLIILRSFDFFLGNPVPFFDSRLCAGLRANGKMILMEGLLSVPPERGTIIGRALWKVN